MKVFIVLAALASCAFAKTTRIIGGDPAEKGAYPYQVSVQQRGLLLYSHICGGSILNSKVVITAGHCITKGKKLLVKAGTIHQANPLEGVKINVEKAIVHENFTGGVGPNDIALLILEEDLTFNDNIQPINLPTSGETYVGDVTLTGWGYTISIIPIPALTLHEISLPLITDEDCVNALKNFNGADAEFSSDSNICTGPLTGGKSPCNGDSGGPLAQGDTLVGIVSWGIVPCGSTGAPSVYTEVSNFVGWINSQLAQL